MSFQKVAHEAHELPRGFSIRTHSIGTGKVLEMSVEEKNAIPGRLGELHTHPPACPGLTPKGCRGNPDE
jgi:hypothetical protein